MPDTTLRIDTAVHEALMRYRLGREVATGARLSLSDAIADLLALQSPTRAAEAAK